MFDISKDQMMIAICTGDNEIKVYSILNTNVILINFTFDGKKINEICFLENDSKIFVADDINIYIFDLNDFLSSKKIERPDMKYSILSSDETFILII